MSAPLTQTLQHLEALVGFNTCNPPREIKTDEGLFAYLRQNLPEDFTLQIQDLGDGCINLLATRGNPSLLFNFHVDTVPVAEGWPRDPFALHVEGDRATGLGACDIKGAAACMLTAASNTSGDVALLFSSDEEAGSSRCIREFVADKPAYQGVVVAEPTQARAVVAHRGIATARGVFHGIPGHASERRALQDSALHEAARWTTAALEKASSWESLSYRELSGTRFNLGHLEGGQKPNMIAGEARVWWGVRPLPSQPLMETLEILQSCAPREDRVTWKTGFLGPSLPAEDPDGSLSADAASWAESLGLELGRAVDFWTEASLFSKAGYRSIVFGPGKIAQAHTAGEWVSLQDLAAVTDAYQRILRAP